MRRFPQTVQKLIKKSGLNLNRISLSSGVSNTYLAKLNRGDINRPGKDKIASVMLALNYTITEINEVICGYDYLPLTGEDIPAILNNNRARKIGGGTQPQFDHVYFDLLLVVLEREEGDSFLVKDRPSDVCMPHELYLTREYPYESSDQSAEFRYALTRKIIKERRRIFLSKCQAGAKVTTFICTSCFEDFVSSLFATNIRKNQIIAVQYLANTLSLLLKQPDNHRTLFMERCPYFHFIVYDAHGKKPKVSYTGRKMHSYSRECDKRMFEGFTSDLSYVVKEFMEEWERCVEAVDEKLAVNYPDSIVSHFKKICRMHGVEDLLDNELSVLMQSPEMILH